MADQWALCKCGLSWWGHDEESRRVALARCRAKHVTEDALRLAEGPCKLSSSLFVILSHSGNNHVHRWLSAELKSMGASKVHVVYGFKCGRDFHMGKKITYNQVVHYGFLHKWLPKVQEYLVANREDGRCTPITHVWYLEADAVMDTSATELFGMINQMPQKYNIAWPGWRNIWNHNSKLSYYYEAALIIEGCQAICCRRDGLVQLYRASSEMKRKRVWYRHFDIMISQKLFGKYWLTKRPRIHTRTHKSVIYGKGKPTTRKGSNVSK